MSRTPAALLGALVVLLPLAACTDNSKGGDGTIAVTSTEKDCTLSSTKVGSGNLRFAVENKGKRTTEFYLLRQDGLGIVGEVENIGPGSTRNLVVQAGPGSYVTACKPGMVGKGIRSTFTVTDSGKDLAPTGDTKKLLDTATAQYAAYVKDQSEQLLAGTETFAKAYASHDDDRARALYASTRMHWERIEPVAESFGTLDPRLDLREADLQAGEKWTGWHRIEKDLWPPAGGTYTPATDAERTQLADQLVADTKTLVTEVRKLTYRPDQLGNGAKELLDEVATGKVTGEEEAWSHTDLWDFQANLEGARIAFDSLRPALEKKDAKLATTLDTRFAAVQKLLDRYKKGDGWVLYTDLTKDQVKELANAVNALSEPLSKLTEAVIL